MAHGYLYFEGFLHDESCDYSRDAVL